MEKICHSRYSRFRRTASGFISVVEYVPERLELIVGKALAKNPDDRYQTANDLLNDLQTLKRKLELDAEHDRTALFDHRSTVDDTHLAETLTDSNRLFPILLPFQVEYIVTQVKHHNPGHSAY
jgi:hypothetical protein